MGEIWMPIKGYEGYYEVSNYGRIKSLGRWVSRLVRGGFYKKERIVNKAANSSGYYELRFSVDKNKSKTNMIHRVVASHFLPNPENKPEVNHIDGNKTNNSVENLEWATRSENQYHAYATGLKKPAKSTRPGKWHGGSKPIIQTLPDGREVKWESIRMAAANLGLSSGNISGACRGKLKRCYGFKWRYEDK